MNSGPSATLGIMFSVTNSGSSSRLTSGDQQNSTARVTPTKAPSAKPPRISTAVTARLESHAYLAEVSVARVASGDGNMNFGTWKASTRTCQSTITARCTIRMIAKDRTERIPSPGTACSQFRSGLLARADRPNFVVASKSVNQLVEKVVKDVAAGSPDLAHECVGLAW